MSQRFFLQSVKFWRLGRKFCSIDHRRKFAGILLAAIGMFFGCSAQPPTQHAVTDLTLRTIDGQRITLGDGRLRVVNFWSTTCAVCLDEMPELIDFSEQHPAIEVVGIAMPYDRPDSVIAVSQRFGFSFPVALDLAGEALDAFGSVTGTPTTFVVDGPGVVQYRKEGRIDFDALRKVVARLSQMESSG